MADVIEVIQKITYEVNDTDLNRVTDVIRLQIGEINRLTGVLREYQRQLSSTQEIGALSELSKSIDRVSKQIEGTIGQTKGALSGLKDNIAKGLGVDLESSITHFLAPIKNALYSVGEQGKTTGISISSIGNSLFSLSGALPLAISLVGQLASKFFEESESAKKARVEHEQYLDVLKTDIKNTKRSIDEDVNAVEQLYIIIKKGGENGKIALRELRTTYSAALKEFSDADIEKGGGLDKLKGQIKLKETSLLLSKRQTDEQENLRIEEAKLQVLQNKKIEADNNILKRRQEIDKARSRGVEFINEGPLNQAIKISNDINKAYDDQIRIINNKKATINKLQNSAADAASKSADVFFSQLPPIVNVSPSSNRKPKIKNEKPRPSFTLSPDKSNIDSIAVKPSPAQQQETDASKTLNALSEAQRKKEKEEKEAADKRRKDEEDAAAKKKAHTLQQIEDYKLLAQAAVDAFDTINKAQIEALDKEISIREKRVDAAAKLAEKGNVEALKIEQARLDEAMKKREDAAKRERIINAALATSYAIAGVAKAALEGGGIFAPVTIAAFIAALASGYALITASTGEQQFAEGGYTGHGGKYQPAGIVHKGEFVMDAEHTRRYRPLLEAMHTGAFPAPVFKQLGNMNGQYASRREMSGVEKKLDVLIGAVEASHTKVNARVDERGVAIITQRYQKAERRKWS